MKNLAITGGLLQIIAFGAGALSLDNRNSSRTLEANTSRSRAPRERAMTRITPPGYTAFGAVLEALYDARMVTARASSPG